MEQPTASVVIPAYNLVDYLLEAVGSIERQDFDQPVEVIVVDDESPRDLRTPLLKRFPWVTYLRKPNGGTSAARRYGSEHAQGRYIAYLDHDDLWQPEKLARQVDFLERHPEAGWVFCDAVKFSDAGVLDRTIYQVFPQLWTAAPAPQADAPGDYLFGQGTLIPLFYECLFPVYPSSLMMHRDVLERIGNWNPALRASGEDLDLMVRASFHGAGGYQDQPLACIRRHHGGNQSADIFGHTCLNQAGLEQAAAAYPAALRARVRPLLSQRLANIGWMAYSERRFGQAFHYYTRALQGGYVRPGVVAKWLMAGIMKATRESRPSNN